MKKIFVVFGTRPEAIKLAPVIRELKKTGSSKLSFVQTGQHNEMLMQMITLFKINMDYNFGLMTHCRLCFSCRSFF